MDVSTNEDASYFSYDLDFVRSLTVCSGAAMAFWLFDFDRKVWNFMTEEIYDRTTAHGW
jgi:hypothetical protein